MRPFDPSSIETRRVFLAYSHEDSDFKDQLLKEMAGLRQQGLIDYWHDRQLGPGEEWKTRIQEELSDSDLILLLISPDFATSKECCQEMEEAIELHEAQEARVIPVLLRSVEWPDAPFHRLNYLPEEGPPFSEWPDLHDAYLTIVREIRESVVNCPFYNLPQPRTELVGREKEMSDLVSLLRKERKKIVVLRGPLGSGKTRLAISVADELSGRFTHGVCYVPLRQVQDPSSLVLAIVQQLRIKESRDISVEASLRRHLRGKRMLLLLDDLDGVPAPGSSLTEVLKSCPQVQILATSRERLPIQDATEYEMSPFLSQSDAVEYGLQHAPKGGRKVAEFCARRSVRPLAIEVMAGQIEQHILTESRLAGFLPRIEEEPDPVRSVLSWSFDLLSPGERALLCRLAVFSDSWTLHIAEAVCNARRDLDIDVQTGLELLVKKKLIHRQGGERFKMPEAIRQFALERLDLGEEEELRQRLVEFFLAFAEEAEPKLTTSERYNWLEYIETELANIRAALTWCRTVPNGGEMGLRLAGALFWFWNHRAYFSEGRRLLESILNQAPLTRNTSRAKALYAAGGLAFLQGDQKSAIPWLEESVALWRENENRRCLGFALILLGMAAQQENDFDRAFKCERESVEIFRKLKDEWGLALAMNDLGNVFRANKEPLPAIEQYRQSLPKWRKLNDPWGLSLTLNNVGYLEMLEGNWSPARRHFSEAIKAELRVDDRWGFAETVKYLADLAVRQGRDEEAEDLYRESLDRNREIGRKPLMVGCLAGLTVIAVRHRHWEHAARLSGAVDSLRGPVRLLSKPFDQSSYEEALELLLQQCEDMASLKQSRNQGREMGLEKITAYALNLPFLVARRAERRLSGSHSRLKDLVQSLSVPETEATTAAIHEEKPGSIPVTRG